MNQYVIHRRHENEDFTAVPPANIENVLWLPQIDIRASARVMYDEEALYLRLAAFEPNIRAENTLLDQMPCEDSCLEFFFAPVNDDERYINIEFNPNGLMYFGIGYGRERHLRLFPANESFSPQVCQREGRWSVKYKIPFSLIQILFPTFKAESGIVMRGNFYKCGDLTKRPHYLSWNPVTSETPDFHRPQDFGLLILE